VTLTGPEGASTSGQWSSGRSATCTVPAGATSCSFSQMKLSSSLTSMAYTDSKGLGSVTINSP
jgi:hypothetical protein